MPEAGAALALVVSTQGKYTTTFAYIMGRQLTLPPTRARAEIAAMKTLFGTLAALVLSLGVVAVSQSKATTAETPAVVSADSCEAAPVISTNEGGCWDACKTCESKCGDNNSCKDSCWNANNSCCSGVGGKGIYKMCGCTDN